MLTASVIHHNLWEALILLCGQMAGLNDAISSLIKVTYLQGYCAITCPYFNQNIMYYKI